MALLYVSGRLPPILLRQVAIAGLFFLAARLLAGGKPLVALMPALAGLALIFIGKRASRRAGSARVRPMEAATLSRARALLEVGPDADADAVRAAHRRLMERVHPDKGGSAALAAQVNEARDILLAALANTDDGPAQ